MSRTRLIKPGFFENEYLAECDMAARVLFAGLWCLADREGRMEYRLKRIKARLFPYDDISTADVDGLVGQLERHGFVKRYSVAGNAYLVVTEFLTHQNPHPREAKSTVPPPPESEEIQGDAESREKALPSHVKDTPRSPFSVSVSDTVSEEDDASASSVDASADECAAAVAAWNKLADEMGFAKVSRLTSSRRQKLKARLRQCGGLGGFDQALIRIRGSPLCCGERGNWRATFDFLVSEEKFNRLMEGAYDDKPNSGAAKSNGKHGGGNGFGAAFADLRDMFGKGGDDLGGGVGPERPGEPDTVQRLPGGDRGGGALPGNTEGDG